MPVAPVRMMDRFLVSVRSRLFASQSGGLWWASAAGTPATARTAAAIDDAAKTASALMSLPPRIGEREARAREERAGGWQAMGAPDVSARRHVPTRTGRHCGRGGLQRIAQTHGTPATDHPGAPPCAPVPRPLHAEHAVADRREWGVRARGER